MSRLDALRHEDLLRTLTCRLAADVDLDSGELEAWLA
ncbi:hypothetical protein EDF38_2088 [Frigoribacterium sp. PhB160]|nr:hypothetical protein EDF38_2088 [Frigoribacterium sp. PhB160]